MARVAIVDDSRSIRKWLRRIFSDDGRFYVVGEASNSEEARELLRRHPVDVLTLDINMPGMNGLEFLRRLMLHRPMPVVMLSSLTEYGSAEAVEALSIGAVDCIERPRNAFESSVITEVCDRVWQAAQTKVNDSGSGANRQKISNHDFSQSPWRGGVLLLGSSTGGVTALTDVLNELEGVSWPVLIAQHMPEKFLRSLARRFNDRYSRRFQLARDGLEVMENHGILAVGHTVSTLVQKNSKGIVTTILVEPSGTTEYRPSVDDLFTSAAHNSLAGAAAVLTGMGDDGARGLAALNEAGFLTLAQSEGSCVVFGMPKAAIALGGVSEMLDPTEIGRRMAAHAKSSNTNLVARAR